MNAVEETTGSQIFPEHLRGPAPEVGHTRRPDDEPVPLLTHEEFAVLDPAELLDDVLVAEVEVSLCVAQVLGQFAEVALEIQDARYRPGELLFPGWGACVVRCATVSFGDAVSFAGEAVACGKGVEYEYPLLHPAAVRCPAQPAELVVERAQVVVPGAVVREGLRVVTLPGSPDGGEREVGDEQVDPVHHEPAPDAGPVRRSRVVASRAPALVYDPLFAELVGDRVNLAQIHEAVRFPAVADRVEVLYVVEVVPLEEEGLEHVGPWPVHVGQHVNVPWRGVGARPVVLQVVAGQGDVPLLAPRLHRQGPVLDP